MHGALLLAPRFAAVATIATDVCAKACIAVDTLLAFIFVHNTPSLALFERKGFDCWGNLPKVATLDGIKRALVIVGHRP
jgi:L-amino acid N-acyltransferase YncA